MQQVRAHSKFAASSSERWLNCAASVELAEKAPPQVSSIYADEGTKAHELCEKLLKGEAHRPADYTKEMRDAAHIYADYVNNIANETKGELVIETRSSLDFIHPDMFGTLDAAVCDFFNTLHIIDFKFGQGHAVDAVDNSQLAYYAVGMGQKYNWNFQTVKIHIVQPRAYHELGPIRTWEFPIEQLKDWVGIFATAVIKALEPNPEIKAGSWCHWCPALPTCPEAKRLAFEDATSDFDAIETTFPEPKELTTEHLSQVLKKADVVESWIASVRKHAFELLNKGNEVPGFKLVAKRAIRKWSNEDHVHEYLITHQVDTFPFIEKKLKSPTQFEKEDHEIYELVSRFVTQESTGLTIAEESDRRPAVKCGALEDFKDEPKQITTSKGVTNGRSKK
jgi:Protein of unknown function (DUF2800)